jgi:hypothetical protein
MTIGRHLSRESGLDAGPGTGPREALVQQPGADPGPRPARRAKLILLRGSRREQQAEAIPATSEVRLDLHAAIDCLRSIRGDLDVHYWGRRESQDAERYQISLWIRQVGERTATMEGILMHLGGPAVVLTGIDPAGHEALRCATDTLQRWIREEESFEEVLRSVAAILHAADTICLSAAGARPSPS